MSATNQRDVAMRVAKTDFKQALVLSRAVSESWFRCQALAGAARFAPEEHVAKTAKEAIAAALTATDSYKQVAATAWPFRALIERDQEQTALQLLPNILEMAARIQNPVSRSDALFLLWEAFFPVQGHQSILGALVKSCDGHWKADYLLRRTVLILASENPKEAQQLASSMREGKYKRQSEKRLANRETEMVRSFFH